MDTNAQKCLIYKLQLVDNKLVKGLKTEQKRIFSGSFRSRVLNIQDEDEVIKSPRASHWKEHKITIDPHHFNAESDFIESLLNHDSSIISSSKIDSLFDNFASELAFLKSILPGIDETDCYPEEETHFIKRLLYDNSSPRPPEEFVSGNSDAEIESFSPSHIPSNVDAASLRLKLFKDAAAVADAKFSWVFFLASKDETASVLQTFIIGLENLFSLKGIKREFSVPRTPQQNGIAERKNRTLIEAARTLLADSLLPIPFWAEVVNTACYVQNRVLVTKPHNKTPYELLHGRLSIIGFMRPFGCPVTILNTLDPLGKFQGKIDEGFLVGYSVCSKAFRVFNSRTRTVQETLHVNFMENKLNVAGSGPAWLFDIDSLTQTMNYLPVTVENQTNTHAGLQDIEKINNKDVLVDGKEHDDNIQKSVSLDIHSSSSEFEECINNSSNGVNAASSLVSAAGLNFTNSTNDFSAAGPSNTAASLPVENSALQTVSTSSHDADMPNLEDYTHSDDADDNIIPSGDLTCLFAKETLDESNLWHRRLAHVNFKTINKLVKGNLGRGLPSKVFTNDNSCVACKKGKQHRAYCKSKAVSSVDQPLFRLHMDLFGPTFVKSLSKKSYCLVITDDYSRFSWVFFLASKDEAPSVLKTCIIGLENLLSLKVKIIRCDNGTKFKNADVNQFCGLKDIKREFSVPRTPQQNEIAERKNRTLIKAARTLLADSLLPIPFWAEAVNTACYETLHVNFMENKPNVTGSGPAWLFDIDRDEGTHTYVLFPVLSDGSTNPQNNNKEALNEKEHDDDLQKSVSLNILSSSSGAQTRKQDGKTENKDKGKSLVVTMTGFRDLNAEFKDCNNNSSNGVNAASSFVFAAGQNCTNITNDFSVAGPSNAAMPNLEDLSQDADDVGAEADINNMKSIISISHIPTTRIHKDHPTFQIIGDLSSTTQTKSMARAVRDQGGISQMFNEDFHTCMFSCFLSQEEPKRVHQALKDPSWIEAMQEELLQFKMQKEEGIDYEEVFAPVARIEAIRLFLDYASFMGFLVYQMNVKSAFLYGTIEEEVYVCQPPEFEDPENHDKLYKVVKALYGLHQAPRAWYETLATFLLENRLQKGTIDQSLFIKKQQKDILLVQIYVDDIIFGATNKALCQSFKKLMKDKFQMSSMGKLTFFLGLQKQTVVATSLTEAEYVAAASGCAQVLWMHNQLLDF
nr:putative ribonuclease H-like domain-containing protein [Tanacetum cinerariifolium]